MTALVIAVDLDGVTYPLQRAVSLYCDERGLKPLPAEPDCWHYWRDHGLTDAEWETLLEEFADADGYRREAPFPEALEAIVSIFDAGADWIGVTSRPATRVVERSTYGWIADWFLPLRSVHIGPGSKLAVDADLLIDDNPAELIAVAEIGESFGVLLDRPHNRDAPGPRVSWEELPALVDTVLETVAGVGDADRSFAIGDALVELLGEPA